MTLKTASLTSKLSCVTLDTAKYTVSFCMQLGYSIIGHSVVFKAMSKATRKLLHQHPDSRRQGLPVRLRSAWLDIKL